MPAASINHINIKAPRDLLKTCRDFYVEVVGLRDGYRPEFSNEGYWLYGDEREALIHMTISDDRIGGPGYYDHVAFDCSDLVAMRQRLRELAVAFTEKSNPDGTQHQIFVRDPCDLGVELNFKL